MLQEDEDEDLGEIWEKNQRASFVYRRLFMSGQEALGKYSLFIG